MFNDLQGMMGKLQEAQKKAEETKERLDTVYLNADSGNGKVKVTITGNREIKEIEIDESLMEDREELTDYIVLAVNNAIKKASDLNEKEMQESAKGMLPGMDMFGG